MELQAKDILKTFRMRRIMLPVIIGLGVTAFLIISGFSKPIFLKSEVGKGDYVWQDKNHDGHQQEDEYVQVEEGKGDYIRVTYMDTIKSINWTWTTTFWLFVTLMSMVVRDFFYMVRIRV